MATDGQNGRGSCLSPPWASAKRMSLKPVGAAWVGNRKVNWSAWFSDVFFIFNGNFGPSPFGNLDLYGNWTKQIISPWHSLPWDDTSRIASHSFQAVGNMGMMGMQKIHCGSLFFLQMLGIRRLVDILGWNSHLFHHETPHKPWAFGDLYQWPAVMWPDARGTTSNWMEADGLGESSAFCEWHTEKLQTGRGEMFSDCSKVASNPHPRNLKVITLW